VDALGYKRLETIEGRVYFEGDISAVARCNINFRCAEKLYLILDEFTADTFDKLFEGVKRLPLENYVGKNDAFLIKGHSIKSRLHSIPDCQRIIKKAMAERLMSAHKTKTLLENGVKIQFEFFILKDKAAIMIDLSGAGLYKRGYRTATNDAPIRETLAAALALIARPRRDVLLWDPLCGSGTVAIEAAMILQNIAPGKNRSFISETYPFIPSDVFAKARREAEENESSEPYEVWGSDIDGGIIEVARENAKRAGVKVNFFKMDVQDIETHGKRGTIVCNPPYGERLMDIEEAERLYRIMGKAFSRLENWQIYVITSDEYFEKHFGRTADKVRKLYNGMLKCGYYMYYKRK
jgi:putative N6-adenine-specific DNA methylase